MCNDITAIVIDDALPMRNTIETILKLNDIKVVATADNYKDAIKLFKQYKPELGIVDINLNEDKSGIDILKTIKEDNKELYVIMVSFNNHKEIITRCFQEGCDCYLVKPFGLAELERQLDIFKDEINKNDNKIN